MAYQLNSKTIPAGVSFKTSDGTQYPANWLTLSTADERKAIGIKEVADPTSYDQRFYYDNGKAKDLEDSNAKDKDGKLLKDSEGKQIVNYGLKTKWITYQKQTAGTFLNKYDWYVVRKTEKATAIPADIQKFRDDVRTICKTREDEITACSDTAALKKLVDGTFDKDGKRTAGITLWPDLPS